MPKRILLALWVVSCLAPELADGMWQPIGGAGDGKLPGIQPDTCSGSACSSALGGGPAEVDDGLRVVKNGTDAVISWNLALGATGSEVVRGEVRGLPVGPPGLSETCLTVAGVTTTLIDGSSPAPGASFWYLARGTNGEAKGPWGFESVDGVPTSPRVTECASCAPDSGATSPDRFVDNGLTVTDLKTCLEWEKKTVSPGVNNVNNIYTWSAGSPWNPNGTAFGVFLAALNAGGGFAGHTDWRLPLEEGRNAPSTGPLELESILDTSHAPRIDPIFGPTRAFRYWSASTWDADIDDAWHVSFATGSVFFGIKTTALAVRAVRSAP